MQRVQLLFPCADPPGLDFPEHLQGWAGHVLT